MDKRFNLVESLTKIKNMSIFNVFSFVVFAILLILFFLVGTSTINVGNYEMVRDGVTAISVFMGIVIVLNLIIGVLTILEAGKVRSSRWEKEYNDLGGVFALSIIGLFVLGSVVSIVLAYTMIKVTKYAIQDNKNEIRQNQKNNNVNVHKQEEQEVYQENTHNENMYQHHEEVQQELVVEQVQENKGEETLEERLAYIEKLKADGDISKDEYHSLREYILEKYSK